MEQYAKEQESIKSNWKTMRQRVFLEGGLEMEFTGLFAANKVIDHEEFVETVQSSMNHCKRRIRIEAIGK